MENISITFYIEVKPDKYRFFSMNDVKSFLLGHTSLPTNEKTSKELEMTIINNLDNNDLIKYNKFGIRPIIWILYDDKLPFSNDIIESIKLPKNKNIISIKKESINKIFLNKINSLYNSFETIYRNNIFIALNNDLLMMLELFNYSNMSRGIYSIIKYSDLIDMIETPKNINQIMLKSATKYESMLLEQSKIQIIPRKIDTDTSVFYYPYIKLNNEISNSLYQNAIDSIQNPFIAHNSLLRNSAITEDNPYQNHPYKEYMLNSKKTEHPLNGFDFLESYKSVPLLILNQADKYYGNNTKESAYLSLYTKNKIDDWSFPSWEEYNTTITLNNHKILISKLFGTDNITIEQNLSKIKYYRNGHTNNLLHNMNIYGGSNSEKNKFIDSHIIYYCPQLSYWKFVQYYLPRISLYLLDKNFETQTISSDEMINDIIISGMHKALIYESTESSFQKVSISDWPSSYYDTTYFHKIINYTSGADEEIIPDNINRPLDLFKSDSYFNNFFKNKNLSLGFSVYPDNSFTDPNDIKNTITYYLDRQNSISYLQEKISFILPSDIVSDLTVEDYNKPISYDQNVRQMALSFMSSYYLDYNMYHKAIKYDKIPEIWNRETNISLQNKLDSASLVGPLFNKTKEFERIYFHVDKSSDKYYLYLTEEISTEFLESYNESLIKEYKTLTNTQKDLTYADIQKPEVQKNIKKAALLLYQKLNIAENAYDVDSSDRLYKTQNDSVDNIDDLNNYAINVFMKHYVMEYVFEDTLVNQKFKCNITEYEYQTLLLACFGKMYYYLYKPLISFLFFANYDIEIEGVPFTLQDMYRCTEMCYSIGSLNSSSHNEQVTNFYYWDFNRPYNPILGGGIFSGLLPKEYMLLCSQRKLKMGGL